MLEITDCLRIKFSMQRINLSFCGLTYFLVVSEMILERKKHFDHLKGLLIGVPEKILIFTDLSLYQRKTNISKPYV